MLEKTLFMMNILKHTSLNLSSEIPYWLLNLKPTLYFHFCCVILGYLSALNVKVLMAVI